MHRQEVIGVEFQAHFRRDVFEIPKAVHHLLIEGGRDALVVQKPQGTPFPFRELPKDFVGRLYWVDIGKDDFETLFYPPDMAGGLKTPLRLVRHQDAMATKH